MKITVIIPFRNALPQLPALVSALERQRSPPDAFDVIWVDDASEDGGSAWLQKHLPAGWRLLVQPERRGAYAARNAGLRVASADFVAFTDVDCRPHEDWIERGLAWLSAAPRVAGRVQLELSPSPSTPELVDAGRFLRQRRYVEEGFGATANLFVERRVFDEVGGFDERLKSGGDYEFGLRCSLAGIPIRYADDVVVSHPARSTLRELLSKSERVGFGYRTADPAPRDFQRTACRTHHRSIRAGGTARDHRTADPDRRSQAAVLRKGRASSRSVCHNCRWTQRLPVSRADGIRRSTRSSEERFRMTVPSYSLIIETANLSLADLDGLRETLDSLAVQTLPVQNACEVLLADSGDVPPDSLQQTLRTYPWVRPMGLAEGTGYEELKMAGANASSGELIVFADGDCLYERTWLEALLAPFSDPSVSIVGGETAINSAGPYGLAVAIASSFPARARSDSPYRSDRYHLNNVAFRRRVLQDVPIPSRQPCYRMSGLHAARLLARGYTILRQPSARAVHAAPNGLSHFVWRFLLMGFDGVVVPRLIAKESMPADRSRVQRRRTFGLIRFWAAQAISKVAGELRGKPWRSLELPLALPVFASAVVLQAIGALAGLVAPQRFLDAVPDEILQGSTCERRPAPIADPSRPAKVV